MKSLLVLPLLLVACAPDLADQIDDTGSDSDVPIGPTDAADVLAESLDDGSMIFLVDATSETLEARVDFDTHGTVIDDSWDVSMRRIEMLGNATTGVLVYDGVAFADITDVSDETFLTGEAATTELSAWYEYVFETHEVFPLDRVYVIETDTGAVFKFAVEDYYDDAGTSAMMTVHVEQLSAGEPPADPVSVVAESYDDGSVRYEIDATSADVDARIDFDSASEVDDNSWELSMLRFTWLTNSATGLLAYNDTSFDAVTDVSGETFLTGTDAEDALSGWYNYDSSNHTLAPHPNVYVVQTDTGAEFKFEVETYYGSDGTPGIVSLHVAEL